MDTISSSIAYLSQGFTFLSQMITFDLCWQLSLVGVLTLIFACHLAPVAANKVISNAFTTQIKWNLGKEALNFQTVNLFVYHTSSFSRLTHLTLVPDSLAWIWLSIHWRSSETIEAPLGIILFMFLVL